MADTKFTLSSGVVAFEANNRERLLDSIKTTQSSLDLHKKRFSEAEKELREYYPKLAPAWKAKCPTIEDYIEAASTPTTENFVYVPFGINIHYHYEHLNESQKHITDLKKDLESFDDGVLSIDGLSDYSSDVYTVSRVIACNICLDIPLVIRFFYLSCDYCHEIGFCSNCLPMLYKEKLEEEV